MTPSLEAIERPEPVDHVLPPEAVPQPDWLARAKVSSASVEDVVLTLLDAEEPTPPES
jgi:hypothetical protein